MKNNEFDVEKELQKLCRGWRKKAKDLQDSGDDTECGMGIALFECANGVRDVLRKKTEWNRLCNK